MSLNGNTVLCIDDFLATPQALIEFAGSTDFEPYPGMRERKGYPGVRAAAPEDYSLSLIDFAEPLIRQLFEVPANRAIRKSMCAMSLLTVPAELLGPLQRTPHFDSSTPYHIAALLYLCGPEHGGTAFYRHNATNFDRITPDTVDHYLDTYYQEINHKKPEQTFFRNDNCFFTQTGFIEAKFNRLVLYKGSLLHSAVVNPQRSVDPNPTSGRLTVNTFFDF